MDQTETEERIAAFSSLADPTRRRLYLYTVSRPEGAGRDEAAEATGISRGLAAFHLDRLVHDGLLVADYRRLTGRTGPGAGRPAKIYRRSERELSFSVPRRNHELLARLFAQAMSSTTSGTALDALLVAATEMGVSLGVQARRSPVSTWILSAGRTSRSCKALPRVCGSKASKQCWNSNRTGVAWPSSPQCVLPLPTTFPSSADLTSHPREENHTHARQWRPHPDRGSHLR